jgi:hypothetical protein
VKLSAGSEARLQAACVCLLTTLSSLGAADDWMSAVQFIVDGEANPDQRPSICLRGSNAESDSKDACREHSIPDHHLVTPVLQSQAGRNE